MVEADAERGGCEGFEKGMICDRVFYMKIIKNRYSYTIIVRPEPEGGFTVTVPALPGCVTFGKTLAGARRMAEDAIGGYVKSLQKHGEFIPTDEHTLVSRLELELRHV